MTGTLVLLRHGESEWNKANLFTGWVDVQLSEKGRIEAARGGQLLAEHDLLPDVLHTSVLRRAITTAELALAAADRQRGHRAVSVTGWPTPGRRPSAGRGPSWGWWPPRR